MTDKHILVVDDEEDILELVRYNLEKEGYSVTCASTGEEGLRLARSEQPDVVLLDLMLPGFDGLDVCKLLKSDPNTKEIAIIMLTAKGDEVDIVTGLELGAEDYITKPFSPKVLGARIRTVLRRSTEETSSLQNPIEVEGISINPRRHEVLVGGINTDLTHTEFKILHLLVGQPGVVFTRDQIVDKVHGEDYPVTDRSIDVQIVGLRKKLGDRGRLVETVRGVGYRFKD